MSSWIFFFFISFYAADGFPHFSTDRCLFNSSDPNDIEFIRSYYYNKLEILRFSSSVGLYVGYTELGVMNAKEFNNDPSILNSMKAEKERYCERNIKVWYSNVVTKSVAPSSVFVHSEAPPGGQHASMLVCSVYDFFPKHIRVAWLRDGQEVTDDVTSTEELADADWYYQVHSHLEYTPRSGEKISCMVEHVSLETPLITTWDPSLPDGERHKIIVGASGLILGLILCLGGFIYYKTKSRGRILVPNN